jgi:hypothetical protein
MADLAVADVWEVASACTQDGQTAFTVTHHLVQSLIAQVTDEELATFFATAAGPLFKAYLPTTATWYGAKVRRVTPLPPSFPASSRAATGIGSVASDPLPKQVALVVTKQTGLGGRRYRGRMYLPFWHEGYNSAGNRPEAAAITAGDNIATLFLTLQTVVGAGGSANLLPVLYHRATRTYDIITSHRTNGIWGTQRRRGDYGRLNSPGF